MLRELELLYPEHILYAAIDNTATDVLSGTLDSLTKRLGGLDLLIISSGIGEINPTLDFQLEKCTIDLNVTAFTQIADWAVRYFMDQCFGHLVAISSIAGLVGNELAPAYNASKAYQINYLLGLRKKMRKAGQQVHVTDIRPGFVNTAMAKGERLFWVASPEKAASQIIRAIERKKRVAYITRRWALIGWLLR